MFNERINQLTNLLNEPASQAATAATHIADDKCTPSMAAPAAVVTEAAAGEATATGDVASEEDDDIDGAADETLQKDGRGHPNTRAH